MCYQTVGIQSSKKPITMGIGLFTIKNSDESEQIIPQVNVALCLSTTLQINRLTGQNKFLPASPCLIQAYSYTQASKVKRDTGQCTATYFSGKAIQKFSSRTDEEIFYLKLPHHPQDLNLALTFFSISNNGQYLA